jgi:hypothetical protein
LKAIARITSVRRRVTRDRRQDFKNIFAKILAKKLALLTKNKAKLFKNLIVTLVFEKNAIFGRKLLKIAENCDHNIDPRRVSEKNSPKV